MAAKNIFRLSEASQALFIAYHKTLGRSTEMTSTRRTRMESIDKAYLREQQSFDAEKRKAEAANNNGDFTKYQPVELPVIAPQVDSYVNYQAAVFLSDYPIMGVVAPPEQMAEASAFQAVIEENSISSGWVSELMVFFYSCARYNLAAVECSWDVKTIPGVTTELEYSQTEGKPIDAYWQGNTLNAWDMYNTYFDPIPHPKNICKEGTYAGNTRLLSKIALKKLVKNLGNKAIYANLKAAFESSTTLIPSVATPYGSSFYLPSLNYSAIVDRFKVPQEDWSSYAGLAQQVSKGNFQYKAVYEVSTEYIRILPSEFELAVPEANTPQVWKLIIINHQHIIYAEKLTNAHDMIPVFFAAPSEDGLGYQTKSTAENAKPFQQIASSLLNSVIASRRRAVSDRLLYNPSLVDEKHINNPNPAAKIPVRPSAFGKPLSEAVYQIPFRDDQSSVALSEIQTFIGLADKLNGLNPARSGQFVKGNKTDSQWQDVMNNATSKDQRLALNMEAQVFTPLKQCIKLNILQYQPSGDIYSPTAAKFTSFDPVALRKASLNFKITDGMLPTSKVMSPEARISAMQVIGSSPVLAGAYNIGPMFSYIMKLEKVDLSAFEKSQPQQLYEQAVSQWNQLAQMAIQKQSPFQTPMPKPADFGYDPNVANPSSGTNIAATSSGSQMQQ